MKYAYYPGCSLHSTAAEYNLSLRAVCERLNIGLSEPRKWICCGSTPAHALSKLLALSLPYQNLAEIKKLDLDEVVVPCAACFSRFKAAQFEVGHEPGLGAEIERIIGGRLADGIKISHPLEIFSQDDVLGEMRGLMVKDLKGLKTVCYYGCLLTRPPKVTMFDECEYPESMDKVLRSIGVPTMDWAYKTECCGAAFSLTVTDVVLTLCYEILKEAKALGAEAIAVACPLCHANLDLRQKEVEQKYQQKFNLPIFYFTQVIGLGMGIPFEKLGLKKHFVDPRPAVEKCII